MILPTPQEPSPGPSGSPAVHTLEAQSLHCLQTFSTQDTRGQPFHAQAQEALDVLLRHPSGGLTPLRWADAPQVGWRLLQGHTLLPLGSQRAAGAKAPRPSLSRA